MMRYLYNFLLGLISGIISGLGIGGGTVLIPALDIFLNIEQQTAQVINLIYFIPTALCAVIVNIKNKNIDKKIFFKIIFAALTGSFLGSLITTRIKAVILKKIFGVVLFIFGLAEVFGLT